MYALLGDVQFELLSSFNSLEESHTATFAQHEVLKGRPRLQAMGNALTKLRLGLRLHWFLGDVDGAYRGLLTAKARQQAQALVFGSGRFVGWFVIDGLNVKTLIQDDQGRTAARELEISLTEFVGDPNNVPARPAVAAGGSQQAVSVFARGSHEMTSAISKREVVSTGQQALQGTLPNDYRHLAGTLQQGVALVRAVKQEVDNALDMAQEVHDALQSLVQLPNALRDELLVIPEQAEQRMIAMLATRQDI